MAAESGRVSILSCGAVVVLDAGFVAAAEGGQENSAWHVPVTCAQ